PLEEHAFLREAYPEVELVATRRDGRQTVGKPCVYFDDILAHLKTSKAEVFGIINSDVYLDAEPSLVDFLCREARGALVYGSRLEVESLHSAAGWTYWMGYDYFFFDSQIRDAYPKSDFMLGVPWWDYWAPFLLVQKGLPIKHLTSPIAYHVSHPIAYQAIQLVNFGNHFATLCHDSRAAAFSRAYNESMGFTVEESECRDMALLAAFSRHEISSAAQPIAWDSPKTRLLSHALVDLEETEFLVTAIVSTYRSDAFIGECLADLVGQTIADRVEIIVVDAASPENEQAVVAEFQHHHPQIRYIRTPERIGVYAAWNLAARQARGRYLMSCSTNDRLVPHALAMLAQALDEQPEVAVAYGSSLLTRQPHQTPERFDFSGAYLWPEFSFKQLLNQPGIGPHAMWRRKLHQEFGYFDEQFSAIADQDFWLRLARHRPFWNIHDFTGLYWTTDDSLSGKLACAQAEYREIHERHRRSFAFESWITTRYFTKDIAVQYERRVEAWRHQPTFHVYLRHTQPGFEALAKTIQSLSAQYYHDVHIVVLSPHPAPAGAIGDSLRWITNAPQAWPAIVNRGAAAVKETDWLLVLTDGDTVEPRIFLTLGEAIHTHPDWLLIVIDEDEATPQGAIPHFKPGINLEWLLAVPYLGEAVALSASLLVRVGGVADDLPGAEIHDLALRTMDDRPDCVGQVQDILVHRPPGRYQTKPTEAHRQAANSAFPASWKEPITRPSGLWLQTVAASPTRNRKASWLD
ncbi:MAG: glycosyltransferase, partial [Rhodocyclales bacterium]|nr:glycosyltransferase [Rhodocyclales bacterium]